MKIQHSGGTGTSSCLVHNVMNYQIDKKQKQTNKPAYQLPTTPLFLLQSLLLVTFSLFCVVFFFGGVIGCGEQVTNCHYFNQSLFTLHSLHFELSRIRLSLESFFFHSFIGYSSCNIQYKFRSKNPKRVGATGLTSHARHGLYCIIYFCVSLQSPSMSEGPVISCC